MTDPSASEMNPVPGATSSDVEVSVTITAEDQKALRRALFTLTVGRTWVWLAIGIGLLVWLSMRQLWVSPTAVDWIVWSAMLTVSVLGVAWIIGMTSLIRRQVTNLAPRGEAYTVRYNDDALIIISSQTVRVFKWTGLAGVRHLGGTFAFRRLDGLGSFVIPERLFDPAQVARIHQLATPPHSPTKRLR